MPFGQKPFGDGSKRTYDFDKVYRVLIMRAIRQAGLRPVRADERVGSQMIHTEMFQDLRDRGVVLADLSLHNPNVFYELGVRHVMSDRGTILLCERNTRLPFDIGLSRVIQYSFDGENLDWEEVERKVQEVQTALEQAKRGRPDSPVHALLETVLAPHLISRDNSARSVSVQPEAEQLDRYQQRLAEAWTDEKRDIASLFKENAESRFGLRSLARLCLARTPLPKESDEIARSLYYLQQYDLVVQILERLEGEGPLSTVQVSRFTSAISEVECNLTGADRALAILKKTAEHVFHLVEQPGAEEKAFFDAAEFSYTLGTMLVWRWQLSEETTDLAVAIVQLSRTLEFATRHEGLYLPVGRLAHTHLLLLLLLRCQAGDPDRADSERHSEAILRLQPQRLKCNAWLVAERHLSYLRWYQAIANADNGSGDAAVELALRTFSEDALLRAKTEYRDIGGRQYTHLRRFLEQYARWLRNPMFIGRIAQILQSSPGR